MQIRHDLIACFVVRPSPAPNSHDFLQLLRHPDDYLGNTWQTVHGQIIPPETAAHAALRELQEETALTPAEFYQLDQVHTFFIAAKDTLCHCVQFCAIVPPQATPLLNHEHTAFRWIPALQAPQNFLWPGDRAAIHEITDYILPPTPTKPHLQIPLPK